MTPTFGFLSIVRKPEDDDNTLTVRSRSKAHLQSFIDQIPEKERGGIEIQVGGGTDYGFRTKVPKNIVAWVLAEQATNIDYSNFKSQCSRQGMDGRWLNALHDIWDVHYGYQAGG
jgi:hypothetical protein